MKKFVALQIHIHPPIDPHYDNNWVEQLLGEIVRPLNNEFGKSIDWLWVTRYLGPYPEGYTLGLDVPQSHLLSLSVSQGAGRQFFRYITFRAAVSSSRLDQFQARSQQLIANAQCFANPTGWEEYPYVNDLGNDRFAHKRRSDKERQHRAYLIAKFIHYTVLLALSALIQDDNKLWKFETNDNHNNPQGSFFQSVRHLFSNSVDLPIEFYISLKDNKLRLAAPYNNNGEPIEVPKPLNELMNLEEEWIQLSLKL